MKRSVAWLPLEAEWKDFLADYPPAQAAPVDDAVRVATHVEAADRLCQLLQNSQHKEPWLLLATVSRALSVFPDADLADQTTRAYVAERLAERRESVLGLTVEPDMRGRTAIGGALIGQGHTRWTFEEIERRGKVRIVKVVAGEPHGAGVAFCLKGSSIAKRLSGGGSDA